MLVANDTVPRAPGQIRAGFKAITPPHHVPFVLGLVPQIFYKAS